CVQACVLLILCVCVCVRVCVCVCVTTLRDWGVFSSPCVCSAVSHISLSQSFEGLKGFLIKILDSKRNSLSLFEFHSLLCPPSLSLSLFLSLFFSLSLLSA